MMMMTLSITCTSVLSFRFQHTWSYDGKIITVSQRVRLPASVTWRVGITLSCMLRKTTASDKHHSEIIRLHHSIISGWSTTCQCSWSGNINKSNYFLPFFFCDHFKGAFKLNIYSWVRRPQQWGKLKILT